MRWMLDTNIVSFAMRERPPVVLERLRAVRPDDVCISAVTYAELRFGAARSLHRVRYEGLIAQFVARVAVLPFEEAASASYADVRAALEARGDRIGDLDMLIAGHALAEGLALVTNNVRELGRVPSLRVEDWSV